MGRGGRRFKSAHPDLDLKPAGRWGLTPRGRLTYITPIQGEDTLRGRRTSLSRKPVDIVLLAVRIRPEDGKVALIRGVERYGVVWSDWKLFSRAELLEQLQRGRRVVTGRPLELAGDWEVLGRVRAVSLNGELVLAVDGETPSAEVTVDSLDLPVF